MQRYSYLCVYLYTHVYIHTYIYIYIPKERDINIRPETQSKFLFVSNNRLKPEVPACVSTEVVVERQRAELSAVALAMTMEQAWAGEENSRHEGLCLPR